ncbi:MAG: hypothetical protein ACOCR1_02970 [Planctomycetota bacterium]
MRMRIKHARLTAATCLVFLCFCLFGAGFGAAAEPFKVDGETYVPVGDSDRTDYAARLQLGPPDGDEELAELRVLFSGDQEGNGYHFVMDREKWQISTRRGGDAVVLQEGSHDVLPRSEPVEVQIQSRRLMTTVAVNGRLVAELVDGGHAGGLVAVAAGKSSPAGKPVVQPLNPLRFAEDFVREDEEDEIELEESKTWTRDSGSWKIHSIEENVDTVDVDRLGDKKRPQAQRSANPFSISAHAGDEEGLLRAGRWFWSNYRAAVSLNNVGGEAAGLAFSVEDENNYFLLRWENSTDLLRPTPLELVRVEDGEQEVVDRAWVEAQRNEWYRLEVVTAGSRIMVYLDDAPVLDLHSRYSTGGGVGLYVEGGSEDAGVFFDDLKVRDTAGAQFTDGRWFQNHRAGQEGEWDFQERDRSARPPITVPVCNSDSGTLELGSASWPAPVISSRVAVPPEGGTVGFTAGRSRSSDEFKVEVTRDADNMVLQISEEGGDSATLAKCEDVPVPEGEEFELTADFTREGEIGVLVEGALQLRTQRDGGASGGVGIFTEEAPDTSFSELEVSFERKVDTERLPEEEVFRDDPHMKHWSSAKGYWWPLEDEEDAYVHVGDFYGLSGVEIPLHDGLVFVHSADDGGYLLELKKETDEDLNFYEISLQRKDEEVASASVEEENIPDDTITLYKDGRYLWLTVGGREIWSYRDSEPLQGTKANIRNVDEDVLEQLIVQREQVRDYYFEQAAADWLSVGRWEVTNRFTCDPRWSHMAAITNSAGALFNKYTYSGDLTVEGFMGLRMRPRRGRYPRVGDFNMAMTRKPYRLDTGYSFVLAGWDQFWSETEYAIRKDGEKQVESDEQFLPQVRYPGHKQRVIDVPWIKGGRDIHGAWYYVKARKRDDRIQLYVDNKKALEYEDPDPLQDVAPAIWTYDQWVMFARVKISYEDKNVPGRLVDPPEGREEAKEPVVAEVTSDTHTGFVDHFERDLAGWETEGDEHGGKPELVDDDEENRALQVTNRKTGGTFAVQKSLDEEGVDVREVAELGFKYRIPEDTRINLYLDIGGRRYFVRLNGPRENDTRLIKLGDVDCTADGEWHSASFDLGAAFRELEENLQAEDTEVKDITFGNLHEGFLEAGVRGNPLNARFWLDDIYMAGMGGGEFDAEVDVSETQKDEGECMVVVDRDPDTVPEDEGERSVDDLAPGMWYYHAKPVDEGDASRTTHYPFWVLPREWDARNVDPAPNGPWGTGPIWLQLDDGYTRGLDPSDMSVTVDGTEVEDASEILEVDYDRDRVRIDLNRSEFTFEDGQDVRIRISGPQQEDSGEVDGELELDYTVALEEDETPPGPVTLTEYPLVADVAEQKLPFDPSDHLAVRRDESTAPDGGSSIMVQNLKYGSPARLTLMDTFSAGEYPLVEFDYRINEAVRVDPVLQNGSGRGTFAFADKRQGQDCLGQVEGVETDESWHTAQLNILDALQQIPYKDNLYRQQWFALQNSSHRQMAPGAFYHIANFRPVPLFSPRLEETIEVRARDAGGIEGYSYLWSSGSEDDPGDEIDIEGEGAIPVEEDIPVPDAYLHVKARDVGGNWGETSHFRFRTDDAPPQVEKPSPSDGARSATSEVEFQVTDENSAVDPDAFRVAIDGEDYGPLDRGVSYQPDSGKFIWDWMEGGPQEQDSIPDGHEIEVEVEAQDFAGNEAEPYTWNWTMDYEKDDRPPPVPEITAETMPVEYVANFQEDQDGWQPLRGDVYGAALKRVRRKEKGEGHCLRMSAKRDRSFMNVRAHSGEYDLHKYPVMAFEYQASENAKINVFIHLNDDWHELQMTASGRNWEKLGEVDDFRTDEEWHVMVIDILDYAREKYPDEDEFTVRQIAFGDNKRGNSEDSYWLVDNFMISDYGDEEARFTWKARDITGIAGYAVDFTPAKESEELAEEITHEGEQEEFTLENEQYHILKVRALDNGDNWGPTATLPYVVPRQGGESDGEADTAEPDGDNAEEDD